MNGLVSPKSIESFTVANRIIRQYYACPEYTITWRWKEGQLDSQSKSISCGQFRCDTLVNYAYAFNEAYSLPTYNKIWTTPIAIYNYFPTDSDLLMPSNASTESGIVSHYVLNFDTASINESNIKTLTFESFYEILQNSQNLSKEQIEYLWKLIVSNNVDYKVKMLFYDFISFEEPVYLTTKIIKQTKKESGELRHKLLVVLQSTYQKDLEENKKNSLKEIVLYFNEMQRENLDKNDASIVFRGLATLAPKHLDIKKANLTNIDKIHIDILNIKTDRPNEIQYVYDIVSNLENPDDTLLITASYKYLTALLIDSNLGFFSNESKQLFKEHLNNQNIIAPQNQSMLYPPAYIEFKATLNAKKTDKIPKLVYD